MGNRQETRARIMQATVEVMREAEDYGDVTMREVARRAGVGVGLLNYHFQTKENLINQSARSFLATIIGQWQHKTPADIEDPRCRLLAMLGLAADFLASYPRISRLSILNDLTHPAANDNTMQTLEGMLPLLTSLCPDERRARWAALEIVTGMQGTFMRAELLRSEMGFDFFDEQQRAAFLDSLVDRALAPVEAS